MSLSSQYVKTMKARPARRGVCLVTQPDHGPPTSIALPLMVSGAMIQQTFYVHTYYNSPDNHANQKQLCLKYPTCSAICYQIVLDDNENHVILTWEWIRAWFRKRLKYRTRDFDHNVITPKTNVYNI